MPDPRYDTYGVRGHTLDEARMLVEQATGLTLRERDSSYWGGTYYLYDAPTGGELKLYNNYDTHRADWVHASYRPFHVVLTLSALNAPDELHRHLQARLDLVLLNRVIVPDDDATA